MREKFLNSVEKLDQWIEQVGWAGFDPYDIKSLNWVLKLSNLGNRNKFYEILREIIFEVFYSFPEFSRKIFRVQPQINPKGMALFAKAYLDLFLVTGNENFVDKSSHCMKWLDQNKSKTESGFGWGYPFDWQSDQFIPQGTPNGIVTTAVGDAHWSWYQYNSNPEYLDISIQICDFLISLPIARISESQICFAYTPLKQNYIHNLNLFIAEFLMKIGLETKNQHWIDLGSWAINYTISNQLPDGSFDYNGPPEKPKNYVDNYHTGFVLRMLHSLWRMTDNEEIYSSLEKCYKHYIENLFEDQTIPKLLSDRKYRIDIHSCAESINCLSELSSTFPEGLKIAENVANWTINNLQDQSGYFYYGILKSRVTGQTYTSKIPYIRWGQAWMLKALSNLLKSQKNKN
jgi:hypothetical protein